MKDQKEIPNILSKTNHSIKKGDRLLFTYSWFPYEPFRNFKLINYNHHNIIIEDGSVNQSTNQNVEDGSPSHISEYLLFKNTGHYNIHILALNRDDSKNENIYIDINVE
jgi:hypothetical protein